MTAPSHSLSALFLLYSINPVSAKCASFVPPDTQLSITLSTSQTPLLATLQPALLFPSLTRGNAFDFRCCSLCELNGVRGDQYASSNRDTTTTSYQNKPNGKKTEGYI
jgi:hypothetical protein